MSLRRPTVALLYFTFFSSPLCGVAKTPDCGIYFKPFMWCRLDARLRHACYLIILYKPFMRCRSDARLWHACYFFYL